MVDKPVVTKKFDDLVEQLKILPGVGAKTAQRMALNLLTYKRPQGQKLAEILKTAMTEIKQCQFCRSLSDDEICAICQDPHRHQHILCVVETVADLVAIEQTGSFQGRYFVLGGHLSPIDGIGAEQLGIQQLLNQLQSHQRQNTPIVELILATSTTIEGQTTAHFIHQIVKPYVHNVTRIAQGIPMGGELEYLDAMTLGQALQNRGIL